ncbi:aspartate kinase [Clostridiaceae bacterium UIB06]|uniref:Aspartokinase n=1 Tax=Clostridium thailandense TaxID=2794346 RepID=A0A949U2Q1_9CLOT|nr:aspartate kinase [Clostridium thailandense]MBV7276301.1 aspartate kinase [Clostridium thailandense]MCH5138053.1 aspartate kinase [Clostridiaceae bacterium UIB06]
MSNRIVAKFGGSSLADSDQFRKVKSIVLDNEKRKYVVPSAPGKRFSKDYKITDLLYLCHAHAQNEISFDDVFKHIEDRYIGLAKELEVKIDIKKHLDEVKKKIADGASADYTASRGEYLNGLILADYLEYEFIDASEVICFKNYGKVDLEATQKAIDEKLSGIERAVIPGFYGAKDDGTIKTFTRGGSDVTGAIIARCVGAELYENWTDVSGFLMADPNIVENPKPIEVVTYKELRELSYMGAKVLHEESIFPIRDVCIPINIRNTNKPEDKGTLIVDDNRPISYSGTITGIAGKKDFTVIAVQKMLLNSEQGFCRKLLSILESNGVSFENMPSGIDSVSLVIEDAQLGDKLDGILEEIKKQCNPDSLEVYPNMALISTVGRGMDRTKGISSKVFRGLAEGDVNIRMINQGSSEINITVGVENDDFEKALRGIYRAFAQ